MGHRFLLKDVSVAEPDGFLLKEGLKGNLGSLFFFRYNI